MGSWWGWKRRVKKLAWNSALKKLRSRHPVPSLHGKQKGQKWKQWQILFPWASKSLQMVTAAMKLKDVCFLEGKANLDSRLKSRDITLPTKVKVMVFPIVVYRCESWTIKKTERWRTDAFELWCWRRLLRIPWTPKRSNQSILKEISPEYSFEGLMLQYFGQLIQRADYWNRPWCWERLKAGGEGDDRGLRWLDSIPDSVDMNLSKLWEMVKDWGAWHAGVQGEAKSWT